MRFIKAGFAWLVDQAIEHWATIFVVVGGSVMTYLASISTWLAPYGPVAWGTVGIASLLILSFVFFLYGIAQKHVAIADYTKAKATSSGVNVLSPKHEHEKIDLSSFYHPFYMATENVSFENCELFGPANMGTDGGTIQYSTCVQCEIVIVRTDRPIVNAIMFRHCNFIRSKMYRITFLMDINTYKKLPSEMRSAVPVVSDGRIGDI